MAVKSLPSQEYLCERLSYDPATGVLTWKFRPASDFATHRTFLTWNGCFANQPAGSIHPTGYIYVCIDNVRYKAHRLIWRMVMNETPDEIDHKNGEGTDNRFNNLRSATHAENGRNQRLPKNNSSGVKGVRQLCGPNRGIVYVARIGINGNRIHLGTFATIEEAKAAYDAAARHFFGEFAHE